ncbi:type II secretion system protein [Parashewanella tropica]|uniref:type II secretion system protein n=1 Tax=Parashewanella tropica TaxID=2547970 RepID=UPI00105A6BFE|nr:prepilin-type N-terminal cleavage/methylation domain-containing protein [Parashewanella tropica]
MSLKQEYKSNKSAGFTLVELVTVIVLLGILSVIAAPKFIDFQHDARASVIKSIKGSLKSVHDMVYMKSTAQGNLSDLIGKTQIGNGQAIDVHYGHPRTHWSATWQKVLEINVEPREHGSKSAKCNTNKDFCVIFSVLHGTSGYTDDWTMYFVPKGFAVNDSCYARYTLDVLTENKPHLIAFEDVTSGC